MAHEVGQRIVAVQAHACRASARMRLDKLRLGGQAEPPVERKADELLDFPHVRLLPVDMDLEEIALSRGIDAHGDGVCAERAFEHGFGEVDERQAAKEVRSFEPVKLGRVRRRKRRIVQAAVEIEGRGAEPVEPEIEQGGARGARFPWQ